MKQSFLDSLIGLPTVVAFKRTVDEGHIPDVRPARALMAAVALENTVILLENNGVISGTQAGDPLELVPEDE